ncbi:FAD-dependent oxidoreductase [Sphaerisporangium rufum]|uniref:FAD-dependent oxidoreductase n=1 Tax=Sphaerisporangium rufum TaxID=1381558 RepID=A0A919QWY5_9ACTN|nr:FAD-dependent monooxygenase [Sphaerisporangium rufum]GII75636.1 FAD-dependent oxidoreductase [Sphaerisporangium rufum]
MAGKTVLISGASIAGPALACWLGRHGFAPTVVEIAPRLRDGGYAVDFRAAHLPMLARLGILDELREVQTGGSPYSFVDAGGREVAAMPGEFAGGAVEVLRADLARVLYRHSAPTTEYVFGDTITSLTETPGGVEVTFRSGALRTFDLVIGADGLHSTVRRLAFGPESDYVTHFGYHVAGWSMPNHLGAGRTRLQYNTPGRLIGVAADHRDPGRADAMAVFATQGPPVHDRHDTAAQKRIIADRFAGAGWHTAELIDALWRADDLYFDTISRVDVPRWSAGRVALAGDAAHGASLSGMGTGAAMVGACVLAAELAAEADHRVAFARYEERIRDFARRCQQGSRTAGRFLAPRTRRGLWARNRMLNTRFMMDMMIRDADRRAENDRLDEFLAAPAA